MLGWTELGDEDRPPEHIWLDDEALNEHFERVKARYARPHDTSDDLEDVPMSQNEFTKDLRGR